MDSSSFRQPDLSGICGWSLVPQCLVRPTLVVVLPPSFDLSSSIVNRLEPVHVETFVPRRAVEAFDVGVVRGRARPTEVEAHFVVIGPKIQQMTGKFAAIVDEYPYGGAA